MFTSIILINIPNTILISTTIALSITIMLTKIAIIEQLAYRLGLTTDLTCELSTQEKPANNAGFSCKLIKDLQ
ncbi:hypothetical protein HYN46_08115 [Aquirhabdus parva]|uniref:Uncharacterized protein n=1 Tax=Aquirhabdus parva TaxID=2283318 RepID=A0A345P694_9GAMM|nr:hypothetical protein HYN46_08115 [Aquirhabdus parva]